MQTPRSRGSSERGAVLIQVAVCLLGLLAFTAFVVDYGVMWASRGQAQTSADAGALAGAASLAFDREPDLIQAKAAAKTKAQATALQNGVWGEQPDVKLTDVTISACPPPDAAATCVRVDTFRNQTRSNALPVFFANLVGVGSQGVRATATAQVAIANAVNCMKPWAVADKWAEHWENGKASTAPWTPDKAFDKYTDKGAIDTKVTTPDIYEPPTANSPGTGFAPFDAMGNPTSDYGLQITLKIGDSNDRLSSGWFQALNLPNSPGSGNGAAAYEANISQCNPTAFAIGDTVQVDNKPGDMVGPTKQGVQALADLDPDAYWDPTLKSIKGSCAPGICGDNKYYASSPRIVPVPLMNIDAFFAGSPNGKSSIPITNIMGFFVECKDGKKNNCSDGKEVVGRLVAIPGLTKGTTSVDETASFLRTVRLVR
jgi:Flp pilus assembly protein TadG